MLAVAKTFGRTLRFFTEPNFAEVIRRSDEEDRFVKAMKRNGIKNMLLRAADLPDESLVPLTAIIEQVGEIVRQQQALIPPPPKYTRKRKAQPAEESDADRRIIAANEQTDEAEESADSEGTGYDDDVENENNDTAD